MSDQRKRKRRIIIGIALALLLAVVVPPFVNANRFKVRLARSVSGSIGRNVSMGDVNIRLLPLPGFEIQNFVIMDDPAFSAEPMLRAESVTARLRLTSLWRGRLEIARLSFAYPSLNLVRDAEGHWNIESLLSRASQVSAAPTAKKKPEARPRFPYIEADSGRINFKILQEKKAHALVEADFSLWQEAENQWNMRLEARPTRTDANLGDTGTLRLEGSFQRADKIENTPMKVSFDWQRSQLGQLTTLIYGRDRGWRGTVEFSGTLEGMPRQFAIRLKTQIDDFRRYDISSEDSLRLSADCVADHVTIPQTNDIGFRNTLTCDVPVAPGNVEIRAYDQYWGQAPSYISVRANGVPVRMLTDLYRHAKRDVPRDLTGDGLLNGYFSRVIFPDNSAPRWIGQGTLMGVRLSSPALSEEIHAQTLHFGFSHLEHAPEGPTFSGLTPRLSVAKNQRPGSDQPANVFTIDPFNADLGGAKPLTIGGVNSTTGLQLQVKGDAEVKHLSAAARLFGLELPTLSLPATGVAEVDYNISGRWAGFAAPVVTGTARAASHPTPTHATETASNQQHAKTTKQ